MAADHELQVGAEHAECLVDDVALARLHHDAAHLLALLPELDALAERGTVLAAEPIGYLAEEGDGNVLEILAPPDGGVHVLTHEDDDHGDEEAQHERHEQDVAADGRHGLDVARRGRDDAGVVGGERLAELVLLTFLEEEEVERLLHLLLAAHGLQVLRLVGVAGYLRGGLRLVRLEVGELGIEGGHIVVDTLHDAVAQGGEVLVVVGYQWVLLAGVRHEVVALQLLLVVLGYLLFDARALYAAVAGQELVLAHLAGEVVADVLRHGEVGVDVEDLLVCLGAALHILLCGGLHVGEQVAALVGGDAAVHVAQLTLYHAQTVGDEVGGGDGHLVLVVHPVLAVDGDDGVEHVLCALGDDVLVGEVDDGALLLADGGGEGCLDGAGHGVEAGAAHMEHGSLAAAHEGCVGVGHGYLDIAQGRAHMGVELARDVLVAHHEVALAVGALEVTDNKLVVAHEVEVHLCALHVVHAEELDGDGQVLAVECHGVEGSVYGVAHLEVQLLAGLEEH